MMDELNLLLKNVDSLFPPYDGKSFVSYNYSLGKFPNGWEFNVVNNWYNWSDKNLEYTFGLYGKPEHAVRAFLNYVKENGIDVKSLCHD